jgi:hypothetical protein
MSNPFNRELPPNVRFANGHTGHVPVRFNGAPDGPFAGETKFRGVPDFEHSTLCRAFELDPIRFHFDLPSIVRGIGRNATGFSHNDPRGRIINGFVFMAGKDSPVAKLTVITDGDKMHDRDPLSRADFENLRTS